MFKSRKKMAHLGLSIHLKRRLVVHEDLTASHDQIFRKISHLVVRPIPGVLKVSEEDISRFTRP